MIKRRSNLVAVLGVLAFYFGVLVVVIVGLAWGANALLMPAPCPTCKVGVSK